MEPREQAVKVRRNWRLHGNGAAIQRVGKPQAPCVQHLASGVDPLPTTDGFVDVDAFTKQWMTEFLQVQPNLMLSAGLENQLEQRGGHETLEHAVVGNGMTTFMAVMGDAPAAGHVRIRDGRLDRPTFDPRHSLHDREVRAIEGVLGK